LRRELRTAEIADGDAGKTQERAAAKGAGTGEQCTGKAVCGTSKHTDNSTPNRSLRQRDVGSQGYSLTRKDAPHSRPARLSRCPAADEASIRASRGRTLERFHDTAPYRALDKWGFSWCKAPREAFPPATSIVKSLSHRFRPLSPPDHAVQHAFPQLWTRPRLPLARLPHTGPLWAARGPVANPAAGLSMG
jgi:hypothetical protein